MDVFNYRAMPLMTVLLMAQPGLGEAGSPVGERSFTVDPPVQTSYSAALSLNAAVAIAQDEDPWLAGNRLSQEAIEASSVAAGALPDPVVTAGLLNLPTDTFDFDQEAMTQFRVGLSQKFPRGQSRKLRKQQLATLGQQFPYQRQNRRAQVAVTVSELWLNLYQVQASIVLIEADRTLFDQLGDVAVASYTSTFGRTRQQDVIRAELELTQLEDRLTVLAEQRVALQQELAKWLSGGTAQGEAPPPVWVASRLHLSDQLPSIPLSWPLQQVEDAQTASLLLRHPAVVALDRKIAASATGVEVARQKYKPEWGINAGYGYRDDDPAGNERADFLSVGVTLDVPLFRANRQDRQVQAATAEAGSIKTERLLLLRDIIAAFGGAREQLVKLDARQQLYRQRLLPQMHQLAQASLNAYTNDDGDFAEVVRARIAELNASIESLAIDVERQKMMARLNYFLTQASVEAETDRAANSTMRGRRQ
jgi:outer membrane protein TolC